MDYTDAQRVTGIFFNNRNPIPEPNDEKMEITEESNQSIISRTYDMDREKGNLALVINNESFLVSTGMSGRQGSDKDASAIENSLKSLHFKVISRKDLTVKDMIQIFSDISQMTHEKNNCFVCVILSHGEDDNVIYGTDDKIKLDNLIEMVLPDRCPGLIGKPKLFFIQACRGTKCDQGAIMHDANKYELEKIKSCKVPLWADTLLAYSTVPGFYSWRNSTNGSWFIQSLAEVLSQNGKKEELQKLMLAVNYKVAFEYESNSDSMNKMKQIPCVSNMLTKELYFY
ncbi:caspase-7-like [Argonauta hians]